MKNYMSKHATQAAYTSALSTFDKPHVAYIQELAGLADSVRYMEHSHSQNDPVTPSHDYSQDYFTTIPLVDASFTFKVNAGELSYSTDNGTTWSESTGGEISVSNVTAGNKVLWKGALQSADYGNTILCDKSFNVEGNVMSLLYGDNFANQTVIPQNATLMFLFNDMSSDLLVVNAQNLILPATTLVDNCYTAMFQNCNLLTTAPAILPATTLTYQCYSYMFSGCTSLTSAPELPATTLAEECYRAMFQGCSSLNYIKCLATDISATDCTYYWIDEDEVAASGTFVKNTSMSSWTTGSSGIPSGWTVQDAA